MPMHTKRTLYDALTGEENPRSMLGLLALLVLLLHIVVGLWLMHSDESITAAEPMIMEVSLLAAPRQQAAVVQKPPAPQAVKKMAPPQKPKPKPVPKKKPPVAEKKPESIQSKPVAETKPPVAQPLNGSASKSSDPLSAVASTAKSPEAGVEKFTEANFRANYGFNPKPDYPRLARSRGWQGKVLLKVQVSAAGYSDTVNIYHSSGHEALDESAAEAVKKWKFIPAKRGDTPVASTVIVPIIFKLDN